MNIITHKSINRCSHNINTKFYACKLYRNGNFSVKDVCRRYKISKASLMRWNKKFDGTKESLVDKSKRPLTPHPNAHTSTEITNIKNLIRRNPNISLNELYGKLKQNYAYTRHPSSLFRFLRKQNILFQNTSYKKKRKVKIYNTPFQIGKKMQLDVKYVPKDCYTGIDNAKFYQYTIIDESSKERFIYAYDEYNSYNTVDFVTRAIIFYGYIPKIIQTDNGAEFRHLTNTKNEHLFKRFCRENNIYHKCNRPRTPWHNGKVERSHREDGKRFYSNLKFYSLSDLNKQMKAYLKRSNNIPSRSLDWLSPNEARKMIEDQFANLHTSLQS